MHWASCHCCPAEDGLRNLQSMLQRRRHDSSSDSDSGSNYKKVKLNARVRHTSTVAACKRYCDAGSYVSHCISCLCCFRAG